MVKKDLEDSRKAEERWTPVQYLWPLHPAVQWLNDRNVTAFGRHQAPVLTLPHFGLGEVVFVMTGLIPNKQGQPLLNKWISVVFKDYQFQRVEEFSLTLERSRLGQEPLPNRLLPIDEKLLTLRDLAVDQAHRAMLQERDRFEEEIGPKLQEQKERLSRLQGEHQRQLELRFADGSALVKEKKDSEQRRIEKIFADHDRWVSESMTTEPAPYIKIIAVLQGV
jgi:hypothetical protein